jgi:hypothetical protein
MGVENFGNVAQAGKRTVKRARVLLAARLRTSYGDVEARLRDLSQKGALVECYEPLEVDSEVVFSRGDTIVPARIAWVSGNRVGLEFLRMIDESEVLVQLGRAPSNASQPRFRRPRLHGEGLSDHERKLANAWGVAVGIAVPD